MPGKDWVMVFLYNGDVAMLPTITFKQKVGWKILKLKPLMVFVLRKTLGI